MSVITSNIIYDPLDVFWKWKNKEPYRYSKAADIALVYKSIEGLGGGQLIYQRDERPLKE